MRILLIEDDKDIGSAVESLLLAKQYTVDWLLDGHEALHALTKTSESFGVIILDLGLPNIDGLEIIKQARAAGNVTPILALTARDGNDSIISGLDAGADDYMTKPFDFDVLNSRISALLRRRSSKRIDQSIQINGVKIDPTSHTVLVGDNPVQLSRQEFKILFKLMENQKKVISREMITQILYGWGDDVDSNTIEVHMHNIRKKTKSHLTIKTIRGVGYIIP
jgi:two-component system response regulator QseB